jgi:hypothetical protein
MIKKKQDNHGRRPCARFYSPIFWNSNRSPGWQSSALQSDSSVLNRTAFALPVLSMERLDSVRSTFSESSFNEIFRLAIITSRFTMIGIIYTVNSFSDWISIPLLNTCAITNRITPIIKNTSPPPKYLCISGNLTPCVINHSLY